MSIEQFYILWCSVLFGFEAAVIANKKYPWNKKNIKRVLLSATLGPVIFIWDTVCLLVEKINPSK